MSEDELTIEENLEVIEGSSKTLKAFIQGLEVASILQGNDGETSYKVSSLYGCASNISCYCGNIRELIKKQTQSRSKAKKPSEEEQ